VPLQARGATLHILYQMLFLILGNGTDASWFGEIDRLNSICSWDRGIAAFFRVGCQAEKKPVRTKYTTSRVAGPNFRYGILEGKMGNPSRQTPHFPTL
jgi:hypothetical protein